MTRSTPEWIGVSDDQSIPPRVKIRIFEKFNGRCAVCTLEIVGKLRPEYDHIIPLCLGGEHRESNLQLLCLPDHKIKTGKDVALKSVAARKRAKHLGIKKPSRFPGSRDSGWKKKMNGEVVRR